MSASAVLSLDQTAAHLASIVGEEHIHLRGQSISVHPADAREIAEVLRFASDAGLAVTPTGGGTKLAWGNPVAAPILLALGRMTALREHSWHDMTCSVEAGSPWSALEAQLALHGQMVALDPLWPGRSTVGGIVSTNDGGALRLRYGSLRDLIIGMTVVLADGAIVKSGGKVVKNVAGYDLHKLMTGGFGTLAVVASVNFRLHPLEKHARAWTATAPDPAQLRAPLHALLDSQMIPCSVQLRLRPGECALDVRVSAVPECLDVHAARLQQLFAPLALAESNPSVWQARENLFAQPGSLMLKASLLPADLCSIAADLQQRAAADEIELAIVAQAFGLMTIALTAPADAAPDAAFVFVERLRTRLRPSGGSVVALQVPEPLRGRLEVWDCQSNALPLMREIKRRFDPHRILNPGRFVGGI